MRKRNSPQTKSNQNIKREHDSIPWRYLLMTLVCGLFLIVGFFFAARQHFYSIDYGIKNSRLRKQIDELEAEKRRLILQKEIALSPGEIKKAAKKIGLTAMTASNIEAFRGAADAPVKPKTEKISIDKTPEKPSDAKDAIMAASKPAEKIAKDEKIVKPEKKTTDAKDKTQAKSAK